MSTRHREPPTTDGSAERGTRLPTPHLRTRPFSLWPWVAPPGSLAALGAQAQGSRFEGVADHAQRPPWPRWSWGPFTESERLIPSFSVKE